MALAPGLMHRLLRSYRDVYSGIRREIWVLSCAVFISRCGWMVLPYLVLYLTSQHGYSPTEAGSVLVAYGVGSMIGVGGGGWLVDRIGYRLVQLGSLTLTGLGFIALGFVPPGPMLLFAVACIGVVNESFRPANAAALAAFSEPSDRVRAYGVNRLAVNLGWTIGPAIGGFLASVDYSWLFWADGLTCLVAAMGLALALPASSAAGEVVEVSVEEARSPWRDGLFVAALALMFIEGLIFFQLSGTYSLFLKEHRGWGEQQIGLIMLFNGAVVVAAEMPLVGALRRREPLLVIGISALLIGLGFGMLPWATGLAWLYLAMFVWTLGEMLMSPISSAWVANRAGKNSRGAYMGAYGLSFSLAFMLGPLVGTHLYEHQSARALWNTCLAAGVVTSFGFYVLHRRAVQAA